MGELETDDRMFEIERLERMKSRRIRVKEHELDRLCIHGLQEIAGMKNVKNRAKLIKTIRSLDHVDVITKNKTSQLTQAEEGVAHVELDGNGNSNDDNCSSYCGEEQTDEIQNTEQEAIY